jgi:hypothetical protein
LSKRLPSAAQIARNLIDADFKEGFDLLSEHIFELRNGKLV